MSLAGCSSDSAKYGVVGDSIKVSPDYPGVELRLDDVIVDNTEKELVAVFTITNNSTENYEPSCVVFHGESNFGQSLSLDLYNGGFWYECPETVAPGSSAEYIIPLTSEGVKKDEVFLIRYLSDAPESTFSVSEAWLSAKK